MLCAFIPRNLQQNWPFRLKMGLCWPVYYILNTDLWDHGSYGIPSIEEGGYASTAQITGGIEQHTNTDVIFAVEGDFTAKPVDITAMVDDGIVLVVKYPPSHGVSGIFASNPPRKGSALSARLYNR